MHRTQIYLDPELRDRLKAHAHQEGISMSEWIRRCLANGLEASPGERARRYFDTLQPLESLRDVDALAHVRELRSRSRLMRGPDGG
jgi:hypothetical protein